MGTKTTAWITTGINNFVRIFMVHPHFVRILPTLANHFQLAAESIITQESPGRYRVRPGHVRELQMISLAVEIIKVAVQRNYLFRLNRYRGHVRLMLASGNLVQYSISYLEVMVFNH